MAEPVVYVDVISNNTDDLPWSTGMTTLPDGSMRFAYGGGDLFWTNASGSWESDAPAPFVDPPSGPYSGWDWYNHFTLTSDSAGKMYAVQSLVDWNTWNGVTVVMAFAFQECSPEGVWGEPVYHSVPRPAPTPEDDGYTWEVMWSNYSLIRLFSTPDGAIQHLFWMEDRRPGPIPYGWSASGARICHATITGGRWGGGVVVWESPLGQTFGTSIPGADGAELGEGWGADVDDDGGWHVIATGWRDYLDRQYSDVGSIAQIWDHLTYIHNGVSETAFTFPKYTDYGRFSMRVCGGKPYVFAWYERGSVPSFYSDDDPCDYWAFISKQNGKWVVNNTVKHDYGIWNLQVGSTPFGEPYLVYDFTVGTLPGQYTELWLATNAWGRNAEYTKLSRAISEPGVYYGITSIDGAIPHGSIVNGAACILAERYEMWPSTLNDALSYTIEWPEPGRTLDRPDEADWKSESMLQLHVCDTQGTIQSVLSNSSPKSCHIFSDTHTERLLLAADGSTSNYFNSYTFACQADHPAADPVVEGGYVILPDLDGNPREFRIRTLATGRDADGRETKTAVCDGTELELGGTPVYPCTYIASSTDVILPDLLVDTRWTPGEIGWGGVLPDFDWQDYPTVWECILAVAAAAHLEPYAHVIVKGSRVVARVLDLVERRGSETPSVVFTYAHNIKSIQRSGDITNCATAVIGVGEKNEANPSGTMANAEWTLESGDPLYKPDGQAFLADPDALLTYGLLGHDGSRYHKFVVFKDTSLTTAAAVLAASYARLLVAVKPRVTYSLEAVMLERYPRQDAASDAYHHERVRLGDMVGVQDPALPGSLTSPVPLPASEVNRSYADATQDTLVVGVPRPRLTTTLSSVLYALRFLA